MGRDRVFNPSGTSGQKYNRELTQKMTKMKRGNLKSSGMQLCAFKRNEEYWCHGQADAWDPGTLCQEIGEPLDLSFFSEFRNGEYDKYCKQCRAYIQWAHTKKRRAKAVAGQDQKKFRPIHKYKPKRKTPEAEWNEARIVVVKRKVISDEHRSRLAASMKGNKNAKGNKGCKGRERSYRHNEKIAAAQRRRWAAIKKKEAVGKNVKRFAWRKPKTEAEYLKAFEGANK